MGFGVNLGLGETVEKPGAVPSNDIVAGNVFLKERIFHSL